jgi:hypothetical protein
MPMWEQPGATRTSRQAVGLLVAQEQGGALRGGQCQATGGCSALG